MATSINNNDITVPGTATITKLAIVNQRGALALGNGVSSGAVSGLALGYVPTTVVLSVQMPSGGLRIGAVLVGAPTADGFDFELTGATDAATYKLHYIVIP